MDRESHTNSGPFLLVLAVLLVLQGCSEPIDNSVESVAANSTLEPLFATVIREPPVPHGVRAVAPNGEEVSLQCNACHSVRAHNLKSASAVDLDEFHQGMHYQHGSLTCVSCHQPDDGYSSLRLADGTSIAFFESIQLCGQCHGPQLRDYEHGAHGGMTGYWDLTRGGRERNHCLHCHDAHKPAYADFQPVAPPRDRFAPANHHAESSEAFHATSGLGDSHHE
ncbi:MAG: hypothetical protein KDA78_07480 [Planctomycetaceae bacterium]|nr:hypothetical protein [Planctomycetaceae bacterium]